MFYRSIIVTGVWTFLTWDSFLVEVYANDMINRLNRHKADSKLGIALRVHLGRNVHTLGTDCDLQVALSSVTGIHYSKSVKLSFLCKWKRTKQNFTKPYTFPINNLFYYIFFYNSLFNFIDHNMSYSVLKPLNTTAFSLE